MAGTDADNVLDPMGETIQGIVRGRRGAGRLAISARWPQIERALEAGVSVTAIWEAMCKSGMVAIGLRSFTRQVRARREGVRRAGAAAKPATELHPLTVEGAAEGPNGPEASEPDEPVIAAPAERALTAPRPSWFTEPPPTTNRNAVYKPPVPKSQG